MDTRSPYSGTQRSQRCDLACKGDLPSGKETFSAQTSLKEILHTKVLFVKLKKWNIAMGPLYVKYHGRPGGHRRTLRPGLLIN